jgi:hypothetical protein
MMATASPGFIGQVIRSLPGPLLRALDAWSHRLARRRHEERMRRWQQLRVAQSTPAQAANGQVQPRHH